MLSFVKGKFHILRNRLRVLYWNSQNGITIGKHVIIEDGVVMSCRAGGHINIADNCEISKGVQLITWGGNIEIGQSTSLNPYTVVYGQGGTKIGKGVRIAAQCVIVPSNHVFDDPDTFIFKQGLSKKGIVIKDDCWLGAGVKVLDGVTIEHGCVIGANAVVTKNTQRNGVYVGIPAKLLKYRGL